MTQDEKVAIQTLLIDEVAQHTKDQPTLLIDVLLSGQGHQWIWQTLSARAAYATQAAGTFQHLLKVIQTTPPARDEEAA